MELQERAKNVIVVTLIQTIKCSQEEGEILAEEIINNLHKSHFFLQHDWENDI